MKAFITRNHFDYTQGELDILLMAFRRLLEEALAGKLASEQVGICSLAKGYALGSSMFVSSLVCSLASDWPLASKPGNPSNDTPVPGDYYRLSVEKKLWKGEQLAFRVSLLRYIIKRLRDWRRRTPSGA